MKRQNKDELLKFWLKSELCTIQAFLIAIIILLIGNVFASIVGIILIILSIIRSLVYLSVVAEQDPDYLNTTK